MTNITQEQFYQLLGLVYASIEQQRKQMLLHQAYCEITKVEDDGRFWDWSPGNEIGLEADMKKKLKFDGIEIEKPSKKQKV